jgi:hypothetical protein
VTLRSTAFNPPSAISVSREVGYVSVLADMASDSTLTAGAGVTGSDVHAPIQRFLTGGNVKLFVDGRYTLGASLVLYSNTEIEMLPGCGFIMAPSSNCEAFINAHPNAPNVSSRALVPGGVPSGGMLVSNQLDGNITVRGGMLNMNSTGAASNGVHPAVTGPQFKDASKANPTSGLWVNGMRFVGVSHLAVLDVEIYDAATYSINYSNCNNVHIERCYIHQPLPLVCTKNTDGIHGNGPLLDVWVRDNVITVGDDAIAFNADDGQEARFGDPNRTFVSYPGVVFGPIQRVLCDGNFINGCATGFRFLSITELIDQITVNNTRGTVAGPAFSAARLYSASMGPGNFGTIAVDNFQVTGVVIPTSVYSVGCLFYLDGNHVSFSINNFRMTNPTLAWKVAWYLHGGTMQQFQFNNSRISNMTGDQGASAVIEIDGVVEQCSLSGNQWNGSAGVFLGGTTAPAVVCASNYCGPNRLLGFSPAPARMNGDAFTNTY